VTVPFETLVHCLKAVAEPTRLRLLALLAEGELTVSEICEVIGQSQPRVSRHLKILCDAGLLDRFREQHWVYYRVPAKGVYADWIARLLELVPQHDAQLGRDRERCERVIAHRLLATEFDPAAGGSDVPAGTDLGRLLVAELGASGAGDLLDVGTGEGHLLRAIAPVAKHALGIDVSAEALRVARSQLHVAGLGRCEIRRGDMYRLDLPDASFDTVTMDRLLAAASEPVTALSEAARVLRAEGRLIVVEEFERLLEVGGASNPLAVLRAWFASAGLACQRLRPVDTAAGHLLIAIGRPHTANHVAA